MPKFTWKTLLKKEKGYKHLFIITIDFSIRSESFLCKQYTSLLSFNCFRHKLDILKFLKREKDHKKNISDKYLKKCVSYSLWYFSICIFAANSKETFVEYLFFILFFTNGEFSGIFRITFQRMHFILLKNTNIKKPNV